MESLARFHELVVDELVGLCGESEIASVGAVESDDEEDDEADEGGEEDGVDGLEACVFDLEEG